MNIDKMTASRDIIVKFIMPGVHHWPQGKNPKYPALAEEHYHHFTFEVTVEIPDNNDRGIEFLHFNKWIQRRLDDYFDDTYLKHTKHLVKNYGDKSCGDIAKVLGGIISTFRARQEFPALEDSTLMIISVMEDDYHGETVTWSNE